MSATIDDGTKFSAGMFAKWTAVIVVGVTSYVTMYNRVDDIADEVKEIKVGLHRSWSVADMRAFVKMSKLMNPSLQFPDVEKVDDPR